MKFQTHATVQQAIEQLPEPTQAPALLGWSRICEQNENTECVDDLPSESLDTFVRMLGCSDYASASMLRHWRWFHDAVKQGTFNVAPKFSLSVNVTDEEAVKKQLREYRHRNMLHILWREYSGAASFRETLLSLSSLADELIVASQASAENALRRRNGAPTDSAGNKIPLIVLAMGKLGGFELNFSSDIDIIFLYPEDGTTDGDRCISAHEYFTRLAQRIVSLLSDVTIDGFVYRVDTRLRPFGESGPPVVSFASLESYLVQHGRNWERYAYVKARVIGERDDSDRVRDLMQKLIGPFVYRRYLDYGVFESLREMKKLIATDVKKRELQSNIKLGPGGIREIEFIIQSLQLVRGGGNQLLRSPQLEKAMQELLRARSLSDDAGQELLSAYRFLRRLENFIQAIRDQQTHDLPTSDRDRGRIALAMRFDHWDRLAGELSAHRSNVSKRFGEIAFRSSSDVESFEDESQFSAAWSATAGQEHWRKLFDEADYRDSDELATVIAEFAGRPDVQKTSSAARKRLAEFIPTLLSLLQKSAVPAEILQRVLTILERVLRRSAYIALLNENHVVLRRLVDLCEQSAYFADEIGRYPLLLDELLDPRLFSWDMSGDAISAEIDVRLQQASAGNSEQMVDAVGQYQRAAKFRIAIADFSGKLPIMKVSDALTQLAEIILVKALHIAWADLVTKHGEPMFCINGRRLRAGIGIVAYGKLGGMELSYGSDLDLVFLHDSQGNDQNTNGDRPLENSMFFVRLVRRIVHILTTQTPSGALYEVDTRLRPSGRSGMLVTNIEAFERYQIENAWTWEHQALLRSRPVAGSVSVNREFERIRLETLRMRVDRAKLSDDVISMRDRMREQLDKSSKSEFDIKQGEGGIGDLEFLVQYLVLKNAAANTAVTFYPDNIRQLGTLAAAGFLSASEVSSLQKIYRSYRLRLHRLALDSLPPMVSQLEFSEQRRTVRALWQRELCKMEV